MKQFNVLVYTKYAYRQKLTIEFSHAFSKFSYYRLKLYIPIKCAFSNFLHLS